MDSSVTRRELLTSAATAAGVGLAGCTGGGDGTPSGGRTDTSTGTASGTPEPSGRRAPIDYREWLPRPDEGDHYYFNANDYTQIREHDDRFSQSLYEGYIQKDIFETLALGVDDVTYTIRGTASHQPGSVNLIHGQFGQSTIVQRLQSLEYTVAEERETYPIYRAPDVDRFVGVEDGVVALSASSTRDVVTLLSTPETAGGGYTAASDGLDAALDTVGYGTFIYGGTSEPPDASESEPGSGYFTGQVAHAYADTVIGARTQSSIVYRFETAETAADVAAAVETYFYSDSFSEYENVTVGRDGRNIVFDGETDTDELYT